MINLLPYEDKKEVERESFRRFAVVATLSISAALLISIVLMAPAYFSLYQERSGLLKEEGLLQQGTQAEKMSEVVNKIKMTNSRLSVIESSAITKSVPEDLKKIIDLVPSGVGIDGISFTKQNISVRGRVVLSGRANSREDLPPFIRTLYDSGLFSKVDSPVSNILKKNNVDFLINLEFK